MGCPLFKIDGLADSKEFHSGQLMDNLEELAGHSFYRHYFKIHKIFSWCIQKFFRSTFSATNFLIHNNPWVPNALFTEKFILNNGYVYPVLTLLKVNTESSSSVKPERPRTSTPSTSVKPKPSSTITSKEVKTSLSAPDDQSTLSRNQQYQKLTLESLYPEQCIALLGTLAKQNKV